MEVIGAAASIWSLAEATKAIVKYLSTVKNAHGEQRALGRELLTLYALFCKLASLNEFSNNDSLSIISDIDDTAFEEYKSALIKLQSKLRPHKATLVDSLTWPFKKEDVNEILEKIERLKSAISLGLGIQTLQISDMTRTNLKQLMEDQGKDRDQSQLNDALKWISSTDYRAQKDNLCSYTGATAGKWLIDSTEFTDWVGKGKRVLFCTGPSGAGKTILAARMIQHLETQVIASDDTKNLAFVFCDYKNVDERTVSNMLNSILHQLVQSNKLLADILIALFENHHENKTQPSTDVLVSTIKSVASQQSAVYIVFDALDELSSVSRQRRQLLRVIHRLHRETETIRIMMTSRPLPEVVNEFKDEPHVLISAKPEDIDEYVVSRFDEFVTPLSDAVRKTIRDAVIDGADGMFLWARFTVDRLAEAHTQRQVKELIKDLTRAPKGSDNRYKELYAETMLRIDRQSQRDRELAKKTLLWLIRSARPLTSKELCCALSVEPNNEDFDAENVPAIGLVIGVCAGLVIVNPDNQQVRLVHYTAQEYLEVKQHWEVRDEHFVIAQACLTYLHFRQHRPTQSSSKRRRTLHDPDNRGAFPSNWQIHARLGDSSGGISMVSWEESVSVDPNDAPAVDPDSILDSHQAALLDYAANYWPSHARHCESKILPLCVRLLTRSDLATWAFVRASTLHRPWPFLNLTQRWEDEVDTRTTGLHLAAAAGLEVLCDALLDVEPSTLLAKDGGGRIAIMWAAHHGYRHLVEFFIYHRISDYHHPTIRVCYTDVLSHRCGRGETSLHYAARQGHLDVVNVLLDQTLHHAPDICTDFWTENAFEETALVLAALGGHGQVVRALECHPRAPKAFQQSVHREIIFGLWPIHKAAQRSSADTFKVLVEECKVSLDQREPRGYSPFTLAADWGNEEVVRYFFESQQEWLDRNHNQVVLAAHIAAANWRRMSIMQIIISGAEYVLTTPSSEFGDNLLLATAVDAGNIQAAIHIADQPTM